MVVSRDLAGLPPEKLEAARRRIAVVAEFSKLERPTRALAEAYAARIGLKLAQFYILVRLYRAKGTITQSPSIIAERERRLDPRVDAAISAAIAAVGADASLTAVVEATQACCDALRLPRPSETAVKKRLAHARRHSGGSQAYPPLVLDRSAVELNVSTDAGPVAAWLTVLLHAPSAQVIGHHVSVGNAGPEEAAAAVEHALSLAPGGLPADAVGDAIVLFRDLRPGWVALSSALQDAGFTVVGAQSERVRLGTALYRLLGDRIARLALRPRLATNTAAREGGKGIGLEAARQIVHDALEAHGALAFVGPRSQDARLDELRERLRMISEPPAG